MKRILAPLRIPALMGTTLLLTIVIPCILVRNDPTAIRKFIGIEKFYNQTPPKALPADLKK